MLDRPAEMRRKRRKINKFSSLKVPNAVDGGGRSSFYFPGLPPPVPLLCELVGLLLLVSAPRYYFYMVVRRRVHVLKVPPESACVGG